MNNIFIRKIKIKNCRNIANFEIPLSDSEKKHLIITGKNGSGKTSLLNDLNVVLHKLANGGLKSLSSWLYSLNNMKGQLTEAYELDDSKGYKSAQIKNLKKGIESTENAINNFANIEIAFSNTDKILDSFKNGQYIITFFDEKRLSNLTVPTGINKISLRKSYGVNDRANKSFIQYIVNLKAERSFARDDNDVKVVEEIDNWFEKFENRLKDIFDAPDLKLTFDRKNYNFIISEGNKAPYTFNTLSAGYSAIISIITELILRMESQEVKSYNFEGIALIDEIETHLHVELQKKILPFLIDFFPNVQFIITTHSPFILSSISNAVICDLENSVVANDLSSYPYDVLIESYFKADKYSDIVKEKILRYESILDKRELSDDDKNELKLLRNYFAHSPKYIAPELMVKLQQLELLALSNKKGDKS